MGILWSLYGVRSLYLEQDNPQQPAGALDFIIQNQNWSSESKITMYIVYFVV